MEGGAGESLPIWLRSNEGPEDGSTSSAEEGAPFGSASLTGQQLSPGIESSSSKLVKGRPQLSISTSSQQLAASQEEDVWLGPALCRSPSPNERVNSFHEEPDHSTDDEGDQRGPLRSPVLEMNPQGKFLFQEGLNPFAPSSTPPSQDAGSLSPTRVLKRIRYESLSPKSRPSPKKVKTPRSMAPHSSGSSSGSSSSQLSSSSVSSLESRYHCYGYDEEEGRYYDSPFAFDFGKTDNPFGPMARVPGSSPQHGELQQVNGAVPLSVDGIGANGGGDVDVDEARLGQDAAGRGGEATKVEEAANIDQDMMLLTTLRW